LVLAPPPPPPIIVPDTVGWDAVISTSWPNEVHEGDPWRVKLFAVTDEEDGGTELT
jgi:hypothetical protein